MPVNNVDTSWEIYDEGSWVIKARSKHTWNWCFSIVQSHSIHILLLLPTSTISLHKCLHWGKLHLLFVNHKVRIYKQLISRCSSFEQGNAEGGWLDHSRTAGRPGDSGHTLQNSVHHSNYSGVTAEAVHKSEHTYDSDPSDWDATETFFVFSCCFGCSIGIIMLIPAEKIPTQNPYPPTPKPRTKLTKPTRHNFTFYFCFYPLSNLADLWVCLIIIFFFFFWSLFLMSLRGNTSIMMFLLVF